MKKKSVIISYILILAFIIGSISFGCIYKKMFNFPCPGCGMTRAYKSLLKLDIKSAFYYHPLFWTIPILLLNALIKNNKYEKQVLISITILFMIVYLLRLFTNTLV